jgi:hypothetical protein
LTIGDAAKSVGAWQDNDDVSGYVHFGSWMAVHAFVQKMQAPLIAALRDVGYSKPVTASPAQMLNFVQGVAKDALAAQPAAPESAAAPAARPGHVLVPIVPSEDQWGGLARDIVMWLDMCEGMRKTPRNLFRHLEDLGRDVPQWLRDEPEMKNLDHVPSKGTRAAIIYRAMVEAAQADHSAQAQADTVEVPRGLLGAACHIIRKTEPDSETLKQLRRFTTGDLSVATAQAQAGEVALPEPVAFLCVDTDPDKGFGLHPRYTANRNYNTKTIPEDGCHYVFTADQLRAYGNARALAAGAGMQEQTMKGGA